MNNSLTESENSAAIGRIVVLGHNGFIGSHIVRFLEERSPGVEIVGHALPTIDLTRAQEAARLEEFFDPGTAVVMCAAIKRQMGDNLDAFEKNTAITINLARVLERRPVRRLIFFSSAAVYGEENTDLRITEETPARPTSLYGAAKFAGECVLRKVMQPQTASSLMVLRPALIYGPGDQGNYGPSGFVKAAAKGERIMFWGDGTELREFVFIDDVARLVHRLLFENVDGVLNVATGRSRSFKEAADIVGRVIPMPQVPASRSRSKPKADHGFDISRLCRFWPDFEFTSLEEGIRRTVQEELRSRKPSNEGIIARNAA